MSLPRLPQQAPKWRETFRVADFLLLFIILEIYGKILEY